MAKKYIIRVVAIGIILRLAIVIFLPSIGDPKIMDAKAYDDIAMNIVAGKGFTLYAIPTAFVAPFYPFFLSIIYGLFNHSYLIAKLCNVILAGVTIFLIYKLGMEIFNQTVGLIAAGIVAIHPELIGITTFLYTEILNTFLLIVSLLTLITGIRTEEKRKRYLWFILSGLIMGISTLTKGTTMFFPFFVFGLIIIDRELRSVWLPLTLFVGIFIITLVPWAVRNYMQFHIVLPIATGGGEALWLGNYIPFDGEYRYENSNEIIHELTKDRPWIERDSILMLEAKKSIRDHPGTFIKMSFKKLYRFWIKIYENVPHGSERHRSNLISIVLLLVHFPLLILAIWGIVKYVLKDLKARIIVYLLFYYTAMHAITFAVPRYRLPVLPLMILFSAAAIAELIHWLKKNPNIKNN
jgi:4-amino-4-deoxy-L-arabinose transferase-like glycosyltransferase